MRILLFGNYLGGKVFFDEFSEWLTKMGYTIDLLDRGNCRIYYENFHSSRTLDQCFFYEILKKVPISKIKVFVENILVKKTIQSVNQEYEIINIHYGNARNNIFIKPLKRKGKKLIVTIWGSDFYRVSNKQRNKANKLYKAADIITFGNPEMRDDFLNYYNDYHKKTAFAGFGDNKFDLIEDLKIRESIRDSKNALNIPAESFVITCGYKASHVLQHSKIIAAIVEKKDQLPPNYFLVFPLTYPNDDIYIDDLKRVLDKNNLRYQTFEDYLSVEDLSRLRIVSDLYINIPITDAASSSMLEYLLCENVVITGNWLLYKFWEGLGLFFLKTNENELSDRIVDALKNYGKHKQIAMRNRTIILENLGWKKKILDWQAIFESSN